MFIEWREYAFKSISHSFFYTILRGERGFSQNESSAWNGTGLIKMEFAQDYDCAVAGGYAVTLQSDVLSFSWIWKIPCLDF